MYLIPSATFDENPINIAAVLRLLFYFSMMSYLIQELELEIQLVYRDLLLSCIVLKAASDESLREEESAHPESYRCTSLHPVL